MLTRWMDSSNSGDGLRHGQGVVVAARWILIAAALFLVLWDPAPLGDLRVQVALIVGLAGANFWLTTALLVRRPVITGVAYALSTADLTVIWLIIATGDGFPTNNYVFYFPALLAISVAFETWAVLLFTGAAVSSYAILALFTGGSDQPEVVLIRVAMLAAVVVCGSVYRRVERDNSRRATEEARRGVLAEVRQQLAPPVR